MGNWAFCLVAGLLSLIGGVVALLTLLSFPFSAAAVLGIYLPIELISNGISVSILALARRSDAAAQTRNSP
ncbi:hypothetical protein ACEWPM_017585 [Roseovarius sp. S4756]|uniref:hypothetical protein n=1 Tax=Roseovarius maritimus TaxID=3342637 RepID=UPI00372BC8F7